MTSVRTTGAERAAVRLKAHLAAQSRAPEGPPSRQVRRAIARKARKARRRAEP